MYLIAYFLDSFYLSNYELNNWIIAVNLRSVELGREANLSNIFGRVFPHLVFHYWILNFTTEDKRLAGNAKMEAGILQVRENHFH